MSGIVIWYIFSNYVIFKLNKKINQPEFGINGIYFT